MIKIIKITLTILFLLCLFSMPYGYYQFVRFAGLIGFAILAYEANNAGKPNETILFIALGLLFQPFFKISLGRNIWNTIDVIIGVGLIISIFTQKNQDKTN